MHQIIQFRSGYERKWNTLVCPVPIASFEYNISRNEIVRVFFTLFNVITYCFEFFFGELPFLKAFVRSWLLIHAHTAVRVREQSIFGFERLRGNTGASPFPRR